MRYLYSLLLYLALPLLLVRLWWRGRQAPDYRQRWWQRLGFCPLPERPGCIWLHAVSLGETRAALPLIAELRRRYPQRPLLVTTTTATGARQARQALGDGVLHAWLPYDLPDAVARFLARTRPALGIVMETELWPNLFCRCRRVGVPLLVANARLSPRSARGYGRLRGALRELLVGVWIGAQGEADAERFRALGADPARLRVMGNLKYDLRLPPGLMAQGRALRRQLGEARPVLIAASTHSGEEEQVLDAFAALRRDFPELLLLLVPRHPERFAAVATLCRERAWRVVRRSEDRACSADSDIFLGDSMGELLLFYAAADLAFVGGSLVPVGGHNLLEAALLGLPVLCGPHTFNFQEVTEGLLAAGAAWRVHDAAGLARQAALLLADPALRQDAGARGRALVERNRGALERCLALVDELLPAG